MRIKPLFLILIVPFIWSCQSTPATSDSDATQQNSASQRAVDKASDGVGDAAAAPLTDLNLKREKIPGLLKAIRNPYLVDREITCDQIEAEVQALTQVLGRDFDVPPPDKKSLDERAADGASTAFLDAVASGASGLIPYRGVVRTLTGANKHQQKVLKAYERGSHKRTFLKGIGLMKDCPVPASPAPIDEGDSKVLFK